MQDLATQQKQLRPNKRAVLWIHQKSYLSSTDILMLFEFLFSFEVFPAMAVHSEFEFDMVCTKKCTLYLADSWCDSSSNQQDRIFKQPWHCMASAHSVLCVFSF